MNYFSSKLIQEIIEEIKLSSQRLVFIDLYNGADIYFIATTIMQELYMYKTTDQDKSNQGFNYLVNFPFKINDHMEDICINQEKRKKEIGKYNKSECQVSNNTHITKETSIDSTEALDNTSKFSKKSKKPKTKKKFTENNKFIIITDKVMLTDLICKNAICKKLDRLMIEQKYVDVL